MTTQTEALDRLIDAVEAGTLHETHHGGMPMATAVYPRDMNGRMTIETGGWHDANCLRAFHGSLDAAKALHEALLPGWVTWDASHTYFGYEWSLTNVEDTVYACCKDNPARAWLLAILKAYRSTLD